jgi:hypothetical protein
LENTPGGGLKYLTGPSSDTEYLIKNIKKIVPHPSTWMKNLYTTNDLTKIEGGTQYRSVFKDMKELHDSDYKNRIKRFKSVISQLKYALKTMIRPKIVFLISEGVSKNAFKIEFDSSNKLKEKNSFKAHLFNQLKDIVRAVNYGGSVLYTINPQNITKSVDRGASGEMSLRYMASESGGKYFAGSNTEKIIKRIKKTTAAYYELAFSAPPKFGEQLKITVKCSRKGVRIHTLNYSERNRPYHEMVTVQKKLFAFDAVTGGSWSRMVGEVNKTKFKKQKRDNNKWKLTVDLPEKMRNSNLDIFLINTDPKLDKVDIDFKTKKSPEKLELDINKLKNKNQYFVIIEPSIPSCIYNKIF